MMRVSKHSRRRDASLSPSDAELLASPEARRAFEEEILLGCVRKEISRRLGDLGLRRRDLAQRLRVSEGRISQMLSGGENLTLKTLAGLALALDARFYLALADLRQVEPELATDAGRRHFPAPGPV